MKKQKKQRDTRQDVSVHCRCPGFHDGTPVDLARPEGRVCLGTLRVTSEASAETFFWDGVPLTPWERALEWTWEHRWLLTVSAFVYTWLLIALT